MNKNEAYETIKTHFSQPSAQYGYQLPDNDSRGGECVYRGDNDPHSKVRCAFGAVLPDDQYRPEMEGKWCGEVISAYHLEEIFPPETERFLTESQHLHDSCARSRYPISDFLHKLDTLATGHKII